jgi:hypothetical protein
MRPGQHGYEFKTRARMPVHVYICRHLLGIDAVRLSGPQPEVTWTFVRILDRAGVRASR